MGGAALAELRCMLCRVKLFCNINRSTMSASVARHRPSIDAIAHKRKSAPLFTLAFGFYSNKL